MARICLLAGLLAASTWAFAADGGYGIEYRMVLFLHQALFVFWLGPDIGVYLWSRKLTNTEITPAQRVAAGRIMPVISVISLACMSLMLTIGGILTEIRGIEHAWWQMAGIIALGPVWLGLTLLTFARSGSDAGAQLARYDILFRWVVIAAVLVSVGIATAQGRLDEVPWVTGKLLLFALLVFFGIMIRQRLNPMTGVIDQMESAGPSPELDQKLNSAVGGARAFMIASWVALAIAAGLGTFQPGSPVNTMSLENRMNVLPAE
ncbi:MAG: hypothetical protein HKN56_05260 [Gammaproteobacteria bacterium]|nr:hypothetical protein [Gammaproteobacteria bacterium]